MNKLLKENVCTPKIIHDRVAVIKEQPSTDQKVCYMGIIGDKVYIYTKKSMQ